MPSRYWGDDPEDKQVCEFANGADLAAKEQFPDWPTNDCRDGFVFTAPAASFEANTFGLFDMLGNVWEWTADCWHANYAGAPVDGSAWGEEKGGDCSRRMARGSAWNDETLNLRAANRLWNPIDGVFYNVDIRLAREL